MRYLITGGAGFIGSHLSETLLNRGDEVFVLDDLSTGSVENIRHLKANPRFHYIFDSIMNKHLLAEMVDECDVVFHLAAAVGVRLIVESPVRTIETNVHGTQFVLDAASKKKKLVFAAAASGLPSFPMAFDAHATSCAIAEPHPTIKVSTATNNMERCMKLPPQELSVKSYAADTTVTSVARLTPVT